MVIDMGERQQIIYMQTRMIRLASEKWNRSVEEIAFIFDKYKVLQYIEKCFGIFHVQGDEAVLEDIEEYLENRETIKNAGIDR